MDEGGGRMNAGIGVGPGRGGTKPVYIDWNPEGIGVTLGCGGQSPPSLWYGTPPNWLG